MKLKMKPQQVLAFTLFTLLLGQLPQAAATQPASKQRLAGTYYLALDAEPYGLPPGVSLPGVLTLHADGTVLMVDGGDFGGFPFMGRDTAQLGVWRSNQGNIRIVTLFLQADAISGDVVAWNKVHLQLRVRSRNLLEGKVNVFVLACEGPAPAGVFNCPDPIESSGAFEQDPVVDVPVTFRRLKPVFVDPN